MQVLNFLKRAFINPLAEFVHDSRSIGIVLLICTSISLIIANSPGGPGYSEFWETEFHVLEQFHLPHSLLHFINDGLMAIFFFLVGMEIKRELLEGELSSLRKSLLPITGAVGGMLFPALIYAYFNRNTPEIGGWGIPTATDIAFSLGIASLLGNRVPAALKVFLTALAIIDDLGAILVIALFYGEEVKLIFLFASAAVVAIVLLLNYLKVKFGLLHFLLGILLWYFMFNSGIHATIAGVIFAFLVPAPLLTTYENKLHHPVYFLIMPIFALANTAIAIPAGGINILSGLMPWGIMLGLFIGKPLGIVSATGILIGLKKADLPQNTTWYHLVGAGILAGIGFTMSIFIATLAFNSEDAQNIAKISVLVASLAAMVVGYLWLRFTPDK